MAETKVRVEQIVGLKKQEEKVNAYDAPSMTISKTAPASPGANAVWVDMNN